MEHETDAPPQDAAPQGMRYPLLVLAAGCFALVALLELLDGWQYHPWHITLSTIAAVMLLGVRAWLVRTRPVAGP